MFETSETVLWTNPNTALQTSGPNAGYGCQLGTLTASAMVTGTPGCYPTGTTFGTGNVGPNPNPSFGVLANRTMDPNYHREYNMQYSAGIQQELHRGITLNWNWNRRVEFQEEQLENLAVPVSAWTPTTITNPLDGTPITIYNLNPAYVGLTPILHETNAPKSLPPMSTTALKLR